MYSCFLLSLNPVEWITSIFLSVLAVASRWLCDGCDDFVCHSKLSRTCAIHRLLVGMDYKPMPSKIVDLLSTATFHPRFVNVLCFIQWRRFAESTLTALFVWVASERNSVCNVCCVCEGERVFREVFARISISLGPCSWWRLFVVPVRFPSTWMLHNT